ncbi:unnamed protein product [Bursaphelenchus xylophilus]|uniref:(pine wood nematode) hypothetical protein n=1 Tax=Bursaphelenchus xylophilus TaxID=6326 RepID=A0A1I7RV73_BURXY|nr:unnamed protein product [Bursaphelenchus xylophilus]CAG9124673.1 unnamed protein product [Bursaphelenchus xylophilus]
MPVCVVFFRCLEVFIGSMSLLLNVYFIREIRRGYVHPNLRAILTIRSSLLVIGDFSNISDRILVNWLEVKLWDFEVWIDYVKYTLLYANFLSELPICVERVTATICSRTYERKKCNLSFFIAAFFICQMSVSIFIAYASMNMYERDYYLYYKIRKGMELPAAIALCYLFGTVFLNMSTFCIFLFLHWYNSQQYKKTVKLGHTLSYRYQLHENVLINKLLLPWSSAIFGFSLFSQGYYISVISGWISTYLAEELHFYLGSVYTLSNLTPPLLMILCYERLRKRLFSAMRIRRCKSSVNPTDVYKPTINKNSFAVGERYFDILAKAWDKRDPR